MSLPPATCLLTLVVLVACGPAATAQHGRGGMGMPGGGMGERPMGMPRNGGMGGLGNEGSMPLGNVPSGFPRGGPPAGNTGASSSSMRGGLQLGPPGRWWDDRKFAKSLGLNGDQQKRMDNIFGQNRDLLLSRYEALQKAKSRLEGLTRSGKPSEAALFGEIDRVAQARADLEKANTHMLLQLRDEMTLEQVGRLDDHR